VHFAFRVQLYPFLLCSAHFVIYNYCVTLTYCRDPADKLIRHRACSLRDTAYTLIKAEMDSDFEEQCKEISRARKRRAESPSRFAPEFVRTKPLAAPVATDEGWVHCYAFTCFVAFLWSKTIFTCNVSLVITSSRCGYGLELSQEICCLTWMSWPTVCSAASGSKDPESMWTVIRDYTFTHASGKNFCYVHLPPHPEAITLHVTLLS